MHTRNIFFALLLLPLCLQACGNQNETNNNTKDSMNQSNSEYQAPNYAPYETDCFKTEKGRNVAITFIKHGTLMIDIDGYIIHIDPVSMFGTDYSKLPKADLLLITHEHHDHFDMNTAEVILKENSLFYSNGQVAKLSGKSKAIKAGETFTTENNITVIATEAYNNSKGHEQFHPKGQNVGFLVCVDDIKIYIAGDTEDIPEIAELKDIDIAFLPVNQPYTMTPQQCINAAEMFKPSILYPYHYGETDLIPIVEHFKDNPEVEVRIKQLQ